MIPDGVPQAARAGLLEPEIMVAPLLWLASTASDGVTGRRLVASQWNPERTPAEAAEGATELAGWAVA
jgi:3-oxoacyl-[acyl-carrier protein] reductase